ncbi:MAG: hypothetical protein SOT71_01695, partial [Romboutsia timonensis]|uniref:hypothetical protein n=1 Tax=Romboutsia timonensis TaxID=1776391 RepID=UPI002A758624
MTKTKRFVAFFVSFVILFNCTSGGIKELTVFAEDEIMPILSELNSSIDEDSIDNNSQSNTESADEGETSNEDSITPEVPDISDIPETPENNNPTDEDTTTKPEDMPLDVSLSKSTGKELNNIYYIGPNVGDSKKISFEFNIENVTSIEATNTSEDTFILEDNTVQQDDKSKTLTFIIREENKVHQTAIEFKNDAGEVKKVELKFEYDSKAPEVKFVENFDDNAKELNRENFNNDFDKNNVYYIDAKINELELFIKDSNFNNTTEINKMKLNNIDISSDSEFKNNTHKITLTDIPENQVNLFEVELVDLVGNTTYKTFEFFKDTAKAEVNISEGKNVNENLKFNEKNKTYYLDYNAKDLSVDIEFKNVENLNDFSSNNFITKNILVNDEKLPIYNEDLDENILSIELSKIKDNKATLILRNIENDKNYKITFKNLKDNDKDMVECSYNFYKDTVAPDIELQLDEVNKSKLSFNENNVLYLKYNDEGKFINLSFGFKDKNKEEPVSYNYSLSANENVNSSNNNFTLNFDKLSTDIQTKELTVTVSDLSNNETQLKYKVIYDPTDYSKCNFKDLVTTTINGKKFSDDNIAYIYDEDIQNDHYFQFKYNDKIDKNNFEIYKKSNDNNIKITSSNNEFDLYDKANLNTSYKGVDTTYILNAKNGSLNKEHNFKVYYSTTKDLNIT